MGAVIGGAIGSVIGASIAPKKGKETREDLVDVAKNAQKSSKIFFKRFRKMLKLGKDPVQPQDHKLDETAQKIPHENN